MKTFAFFLVPIIIYSAQASPVKPLLAVSEAVYKSCEVAFLTEVTRSGWYKIGHNGHYYERYCSSIQMGGKSVVLSLISIHIAIEF